MTKKEKIEKENWERKFAAWQREHADELRKDFDKLPIDMPPEVAREINDLYAVGIKVEKAMSPAVSASTDDCFGDYCSSEPYDPGETLKNIKSRLSSAADNLVAINCEIDERLYEIDEEYHWMELCYLFEDNPDLKPDYDFGAAG